MIDTKRPSTFLTKNQLAEHLGVSVRTIDAWKAVGVIPYTKIDRVIRFRLDAVNAALDRFTVHAGGVR